MMILFKLGIFLVSSRGKMHFFKKKWKEQQLGSWRCKLGDLPWTGKYPKRKCQKEVHESQTLNWEEIFFWRGSYLGVWGLETAVVQCDDFDVKKSKTMLRVKGYIEVPHHLSRNYSNCFYFWKLAACPWKKLSFFGTVPFQGPTVELRGVMWFSHAILVFIHAWGAIFYAVFLWLAIKALAIWFVCCEIRSTLQWCRGWKIRSKHKNLWQFRSYVIRVGFSGLFDVFPFLQAYVNSKSMRSPWSLCLSSPFHLLWSFLVQVGHSFLLTTLQRGPLLGIKPL